MMANSKPHAGPSREGSKTARLKAAPDHGKWKKHGSHRSEADALTFLEQKVRKLDEELRHADQLPADVQVEKERALQSYRRQLADGRAARRRNAMISKYHKVRFFGAPPL